jgi:hypothetical protein
VRVLRVEGVLQRLRTRELWVAVYVVDDAALFAFAAALAAHPKTSPLAGLCISDCSPPQLHATDGVNALLDAALTTRLPKLEFSECGLSSASASSLARLLGGGALTSLTIEKCNVEDEHHLLDAPAASLLAGALRRNDVLQSLCLRDVGLWCDGVATMVLLTALVGHPSLRELELRANKVAAAHVECAALFALIAANAPALQKLDVTDCHLGDAGLCPLMDALARNTHLRVLFLQANGMSKAFARDVLLPAVRANTGLHMLAAALGRGFPESREAEALVAARAAAADTAH